MILYLALTFGPLLVGLLLAAIWRATGGRIHVLSSPLFASFTVAAAIVVLGYELVLRLWGTLPIHLPIPLIIAFHDYRPTIPLIVGIVGLFLLALPIRPRGGSGSADLTRRSPTTFARGRWFILPAVVLVIILTATVAAGFASQVDPETGRYALDMVDGGLASVGASIYGWFYSVPALIALTALVLLTFAALALIARPALDEDRETDIRVRETRTRNIIVAATGTMLLHLAIIFASLSGTASAKGTITTPDGPAFIWSPIAALEPVFMASAYMAGTAGIALWVSVALTAIPARRLAMTQVKA